MNIKKVLLLVLLVCSVLLMSSCGDLLDRFQFANGGSSGDNDGCDHAWQDATCDTPKTCKKCSQTQGAALGHIGGVADCTKKAECTRCGEAYGNIDSNAHYGEVVWFKHVDTHYRGYTCCGLATSESESHAKVDGVCSVCDFDPAISVSESVISSDGASATLGINVADNPGIIGLELTVTFDSNAIKLLSAESGIAMKGLVFTAPKDVSKGGTFLWDGVEMSDKDVQNGEMLILKFDVSNVPAGEYLILIKAVAYDSELNALPFKTMNGVISVPNH